MQLDQTPFFRKTITPWYDSTFSCWVLILAMIPIFTFSVAGVLLAGSDPNLSGHTWFPLLLAFLSGFLALKIFLRLKTRADQD